MTEAARASEPSRGFAFVASEFKALAEQTSKATDEMGQQVSGTIEKLSEISSATAAAVEEQGAATQEISRNVQ
jgi:methyl-accepting chemotaxis protein